MERIAHFQSDSTQLARVGLAIYLPLGGTLLPEAAFYRRCQVSDLQGEPGSARSHSSAVRAIATRDWLSDTSVWVRNKRALRMKHLLSSVLRRLSVVLRSLRTRIIEAHQKRKLGRMLKRVGSIRYLEKGIRTDRPTTERLLLAMGARRTGSDEWTLN
jgi:hypothetical protein